MNMKCNPKISIIVPIYNVEKYLNKCVDSILKQTYKNIEIILVDDGSQDSCPRICDTYKKQDSRVVVIHKKNGGLSDARNYGIMKSTGEYVGFIDSDDYVEPTMYEELITGMIKNDCLLGECGVKCIYSDKIVVSNSNKEYVLDSTIAIKKYYSSKKCNKIPRTAVWSKVFHRSLFADKLFPTGEIHEDYYLVMRCMVESKKIYYIEKPLYNHIYTNVSSITSAPFNEKDLYKEIQFKNTYQYLIRNNMIDEANLAMKEYFNLCKQFYYRCYYSKIGNYKEYLQIIKANFKIIKKLNYTFKEKIQYYVLYISPKAYLVIRFFKKNL